ncbi:hypothetical protein ACRAWF_25860 [Streptomyces sp. L7]
MPAADAARDIRLGPFAGLEESERLAVNVYTVYRQLDPGLPPLDGPQLFGRMALPRLPLSRGTAPAPSTAGPVARTPPRLR